MDRPKALAVFREIMNTLGDFSPDFISLDEKAQVVENEKADGYQIRLKCSLNAEELKAISPVLERNGLKIRLTNEYSTIYKQHK